MGTRSCEASRRGVEQLVACRAHNPKVGGSNPPSATTMKKPQHKLGLFCAGESVRLTEVDVLFFVFFVHAIRLGNLLIILHLFGFMRM